MTVGSSILDLSHSIPVFLGSEKKLLKAWLKLVSVFVYYIKSIDLFEKNYFRKKITNKSILLTAADIAVEYISDFVAGRPLSILAKIYIFKLSNRNINAYTKRNTS